MPKSRQTLAQTRERLLTAGATLLSQHGHDVAIKVKLSEVVAAAGHTTGAAYQIWDSQADFQRDLALFVASRSEYPGPDAIAEQYLALLASEPTFEEVIRLGAEYYVAEFFTSEEFFTVLPLVASRDRPDEVTEALVSVYERVRIDFGAMFLDLLERYGRRVREPYTIDDVTVAITAAVEGLALRHRVESSAIRTDIDEAEGEGPWHLLGTIIAAYGEFYSEKIP